MSDSTPMAETQSAPSLRELSEAASEQTQRGFAIIRFADRYGEACSLQKSSLATEDCVWFGIESANPQIMASQARAHGLDPQSGSGWVPYPIPREVSLSTRMHLSREDVAALLPILAHFAETGELSHAALPTTLTEAVAAARAEGVREGLERALRRISVYAGMAPEDDETWKSWYAAAFDMLAAELERKKKTAPPTAARAESWQPIETAPKDGKPMLLACADWPFTLLRDKPVPIKVGGWNHETGNWQIFGASWSPTHWMPLPAPPTTPGGRTDG